MISAGVDSIKACSKLIGSQKIYCEELVSMCVKEAGAQFELKTCYADKPIKLKKARMCGLLLPRLIKVKGDCPAGSTVGAKTHKIPGSDGAVVDEQESNGKMKVLEVLLTPLWVRARIKIGDREQLCSLATYFKEKRTDGEHGPFEVQIIQPYQLKKPTNDRICVEPSSLKPATLTRDEVKDLKDVLQEKLDQKQRWLSRFTRSEDLSDGVAQVRFNPSESYQTVERTFFGGGLRKFGDCYSDSDCPDASARVILVDGAQILFGSYAANDASKLPEEMSARRFGEKTGSSLGGFGNGRTMDVVFSKAGESFVIVDLPSHQMYSWCGNLLRAAAK